MNKAGTQLITSRETVPQKSHPTSLGVGQNWMVSTTARHLDVVALCTGENHED